MSDVALIDRVIVHPEGCWSTTGHLERRNISYRRIYRILRGDYLHHLHHTCENPGCVNPWHLLDLTKSEHTKLHPLTLAGWHRERQESETCPKGHPWEGNTYIHPGSGKRECSECRRQHRRALRAIA